MGDRQSKYVRAARYLAPNLITTASLTFGMLSLVASYEGRHVDAGWLIIYAVLTDRLDGFVARLVRGTSELGVQLDSFADMLNFGIAPAFLLFSSLGQAAPLDAGWGRAFLVMASAAWVFSATFRLARYNITPDDNPGPLKIFFGVPTTLAGGFLVIWYLALLKYAQPGETFGGHKLFGDVVTPSGVWQFVPLFLVVGAYLMASSLRMPKLGVMRSKAANVFVFVNVGLGALCGILRIYPEYMVFPPTLWLVLFLVWGQLSPSARALRPPPIFPPRDPPPGQEPVRPEDDLLPEGIDTPLDPVAPVTGGPPSEPQR